MWGGNRGHPDAPEILVATPAIAMILTAKKTKSARECPCVRLWGRYDGMHGPQVCKGGTPHIGLGWLKPGTQGAG
jgi:hypothetical protein